MSHFTGKSHEIAYGSPFNLANSLSRRRTSSLALLNSSQSPPMCFGPSAAEIAFNRLLALCSSRSIELVRLNIVCFTQRLSASGRALAQVAYRAWFSVFCLYVQVVSNSWSKGLFDVPVDIPAIDFLQNLLGAPCHKRLSGL